MKSSTFPSAKLLRSLASVLGAAGGARRSTTRRRKKTAAGGAAAPRRRRTTGLPFPLPRVRRASAPSARTTGADPQGKSLWPILVFVAIAVVWWLIDGGARQLQSLLREGAPQPAAREEQSAAPSSPKTLRDGLWWEGSGVVEKVLPDDLDPPRHQRFFLRDDRGRSLFFAHNIDAAPRVPDLRKGDKISFRGEWRENDMGGAMHWTHASENPRRKGGWLERDGVRYE